MVTKRYYNLTGGLNTSYGLGTINQGTNRTESPEMVNVEYYKLSGLQTMAGNTQFGSTLDSKITAGYEYILEDESYMIVCTRNGGVYEYDKLTTDYVKIYQFHTPTTRHSIASFNYGIIITNGVDDLVYYRKNRKDLLTGEVSITSGSSLLTGTGTLFKTELSVGDRIQIGDNFYYVDEITDDTNLTIVETAVATVENSDFYLSDISRCNAVLVNSDDENINIPVRGLALASYRGRIWVGDREGRLFYSEVGNIHGWDIRHDAGAFDSFFEDNTDFVALGLWAEYLVAHKRERTYLVDASQTSSSNWQVKQYSEYTCDSQQSFVVANNGYYIFSREAGGIYPMLSRSLYSVLYQAKEVSLKIHDSFDIINSAKYDEIYAVYHPSKKYIMFYIPMLNGIGSNECYIFDVQTNSWLHRQVPQEVTCAFQYKDQVYIGTAQGKILKEFSGRTFDGEKINFSWKSPWFTWGGGTDWTTTREARFKISEEGASKFHVRTLRDGSSEFKSRIINNDNPNLDSLVWDIGYQAGDETVKDTQLEKLPVYKYTTSSNYIFYSLVNSELARTVPIKLFYSDDITGDYTYSTLVTELVDGSEEDNNFVVFEPQEVYAWGRIYDPVPKIKAYKHPTMENVYVWVNTDDLSIGLRNTITHTVDKTLDNTAYTEENTQVQSFYNGTSTTSTPKSLWGEITQDDLVSVSKIYISFKCRILGAGAMQDWGVLNFCFNSKRSKAYDDSTSAWKGNWNCINRPSTPYGNNHNIVVQRGAARMGSSNSQQNTAWFPDENLQVMERPLTSSNYPDLIMEHIYEITPSNIYGGGSDYKIRIRSFSGDNGFPFDYTFEGHTNVWDFIGGGDKNVTESIGIVSTLNGPNFFYGDSVRLVLTKQETVWNDSLDYKLARDEVSVSNFSEDTIIVDGVTYTRDTSKDAQYNPNDMDKIVFTKEAQPTVGTEFYYDRNFTRSYQFVKAVPDTDQVMMDDDEILSQIPSLDTVNEIPHFYKSQVVEYTNDGQVNEIPNPDYYNYPEPTTDTLTDTVWDEYAWVKTGHITRRILLPNQYFQSLQFEFFGDALDENMYLYGFEVDGIQLTEHPY